MRCQSSVPGPLTAPRDHRGRCGHRRAADDRCASNRSSTTYDTITVVGASDAPDKAAHYVPEHMPATTAGGSSPSNPTATEILGEPAYPTLADVPEQVGLVDVFRPRPAADVARQAVAAGASALWLQLHIVSAEARSIAETPGCSTSRTAACSSSSGAWARARRSDAASD